MSDSAAGYAMAIGGPYVPETWLTLGLLATTSAGLYAFGMSLNDIADRKRDLDLAPTRVLPSGRLSLTQAVIACLIALAISAAALFFADQGDGPRWQRFILWGLTVSAIVAYDSFIKIPPLMGLVRASNVLIGVATGARIYAKAPELVRYFGGGWIDLWHLGVVAVPEFVYVTALTYVSTLEEGPVDRKRLWIGASTMMAAALLAASWIPVSGLLWRLWSSSSRSIEIETFRLQWLAIGVASFLVHWIFRRAWRARDRKGVMLLVRDGIGGIILLNATLLMSVGLLKAGLVLIALVIPAILSVWVFKRLA